MQVDPIKTTLKPPRTNHLKLEYDGPLSSFKFCFQFNLRRYYIESSGSARLRCRVMEYVCRVLGWARFHLTHVHIPLLLLLLLEAPVSPDRLLVTQTMPFNVVVLSHTMPLNVGI